MNLTDFENWCAEQVAVGCAPSLSVAAAVDGELAFAAAFGYADVEHGRPATTETAYLLASVTKPMTATAVCRLADAGKLQLDDSVETILGTRFVRLRGAGTPTVRHVLHHASGLGLHYEFFYADTDGACRPFTETIERYGVLYCDPGTRFCYSNLGYGVLDEVIRRTSGRPPEQYMRDAVFVPLGMDTGFVGPEYVDAERAAQRYSGKGDVLPVYDLCHRGASAAWMSASDLVRFGLSQAGGPTVLSPHMQAEMTTSTFPLDPTRRYGLGWSTWRAGEHEVVGHTGGMPGVSTRLVVIPRIGFVAAVLVNQSASGASAIADDALNRLLSTLVPDVVEERHAPESKPATGGLEGTWKGSVTTYAGTVPLAVAFGASGAVSANLAGSDAAALAVAPSAFYPSADVVLQFPLQLPTPEAHVRSPHLALNLFRAGDTLVGAATACPDPDETDGRGGNAYSHRCELSPG